MTLRSLLLTLTAATAVFAVSQAKASPAGDAWLADSRGQIEQRLTAAGVGEPLAVQIKVSNDPGGYGVQLTAASRDQEAAARAALRGLKLASPPDELLGRKVTFKVGGAAQSTAAAGR